ncbi:MAG: AAC(3) family N-acetyltransferase [Alphaproteobacteria bacterium]|nr:AAC(3) family N-acetyltransferase [Alphaproteobacteria bacterium]
MADAASLTAELRAALPPGGVWIVHSSCRSLGAVEGGADAVVEALIAALGPEGTLMVPTFTTNLTDPARWAAPLAGHERLATMARIPAFRADRSPSFEMGAIPEAVRRHPRALRSDHPVTSWTSIGRRARELLADHPLDDPEGEGGPLGRAWRLNATILLIGVGQDRNTTIHLAESMLDLPHLHAMRDRYPVDGPDGRSWREVEKTTHCSDGFVALEPLLVEVGVMSTFRLGDALVRRMSSPDVVRVATELLRRDPTALLCHDPVCPNCVTSRTLLQN